LFFQRPWLFKIKMQRKYFISSMALIAGLGLAACKNAEASPAPVLHLGLHADSSAGAIIAGEGDTLWNIAQRYRIPVRDIIDLNHLQQPYALTKGQRLKLPAPVAYRVKGGDTLYTVAGMFGVPVSQLARANNIPAPYMISPGQNLRVPSVEKHVAAVLKSPPHTITPAKQIFLSHAESRKVGKRREVVVAREAIHHHPSPLPTLATAKPSSFIWPVHGKVVSGYGIKEGGLYNDGINIAAPRGTPVAAAADGVVAYVGNDLKSYGNLVLIRHGGGTMTAYAHLASINVKKGTPIRKGQAIGSVGTTGAVSAAQLHFEIRNGSKTFDPKRYLG
jgi:murein DD-endopeptidase MepM/ murein hydrolase activator NlpD